jgi:MFS family permease
MATLRNYLIVTASYWGFTLVDGALRMLVLLHFFRLGYTPFTLAFLFLLYETAGIAANLGGGWLASRFGIPRMLATGQTLQIAGLIMLSALDPGWSAALSVAWVVVAQGVAGVAKDVTKTASKSAIKATSVEGSGQLFRWVAWFTGSKNAMKGIGFFVGGLLLELVGFRPALWLMAALLALILAAGIILLPRELGKAKSSKSVKELFGKSRGVNLLAAARIFMFGARDVWFVVGLPVFLYANGWRFLEVGGFLAAWTIAYGGIQAIAPSMVTRSRDGLSREVPAARLWAALLAAVPVVLAFVMQTPGLWRPDIVLVAGLALFGLPFAVNSSLHSYLILAYAGSKKAAEDVGFYYAANATGRLVGIILSGLLSRSEE